MTEQQLSTNDSEEIKPVFRIKLALPKALTVIAILALLLNISLSLHTYSKVGDIESDMKETNEQIKQIPIMGQLIKGLLDNDDYYNKEIEALKQITQNQPYQSAFIDTSSINMYRRIDSVSGYFLFIVKDITPYLNGYKIKFTIGNPSYATYKGYKLKILWGDNFLSLKEANFSFTQDLKPGSWNNAEFVLAPAKSEEVNYIVVSIETDIIQLQTW